MISGNVFAKSRGITIRREHFKSKKRCKTLLKDFLNEFPDFEVSIILDDLDNILTIPASQIQYGVYFKFKIDGPICCAWNRFVPSANNGFKFILECSIDNKPNKLRYKNTESASKRYLILCEDISGSAKQKDRRFVKNFQP